MHIRNTKKEQAAAKYINKTTINLVGHTCKKEPFINMEGGICVSVEKYKINNQMQKSGNTNKSTLCQLV